MGLLDQLGSMLGNSDSKIDYSAVMQWVNQQGGISGLLENLRQGDIAELVQSWISKGENLPISATQIQQVLSSDAIQQLASKLGLGSAETSGLLAEYLPTIIDKLSPDGNEPANGDLLSQGLDLLKGKLFS